MFGEQETFRDLTNFEIQLWVRSLREKLYNRPSANKGCTIREFARFYPVKTRIQTRGFETIRELREQL